MNLSKTQLNVMFGHRGRSLYDAVRGIDPSPVLPVDQRQPVVSSDYEFGNDTNNVAVVKGALFQLVEKVGMDLRNRRMTTRRIRIVLDYSDGRRIARQAVTHPATANDFLLFSVAKAALERAWTRRVRIRYLRLICDRLIYPPAQIELFAEYEQKKRESDNLILAFDSIRRRYGFNAICVGRTLYR